MDMEAPIPLSNRHATIIGTAVTFQTLAVVAVALRFFARVHLAHGIRIDDVFVVIASVCAMFVSLLLMIEMKFGLGRHIATLTVDQIHKFLLCLILANCGYCLSTTSIKISILLQYIRISSLHHILFRRFCLSMIGLVSIWGLVFFFLNLFDCKPISGAWRFELNAHCRYFASPNAAERTVTIVTQAALNVVFDMIVFIAPLVLVRSLKLSRRAMLGLLGVFALGAVVVTSSILRLENILRSKVGGLANDPIYSLPESVIWSVLEVNIAVVSASIPIFWPVIAKIAFGKIVIVSEVRISSEPRKEGENGRPSDELELAWSNERMAHARH